MTGPGHNGTARPRSVAVIGSGVSGLTAAHVLARHDRVTLFEADDRLGGHADTHSVDVGGGRTVNVDTGFLVHNDRTYPTLQRLLRELGVATRETDMSMSVRDDASGLEYAGGLGIRGLFPTARNLTRPRYLHMLAEVPRFHRAAQRALAASPDSGAGTETLGAFLHRHRFGAHFTEHFVTPIVAAVWSCDPSRAADYPARYLFRFLEHHGMLTVTGSPTWRTVAGGSAQYVARIADEIAEIRLAAPVLRVTRGHGGVHIRYAERMHGRGSVPQPGEQDFDAAVIAVHPHQAAAMLTDPERRARSVLTSMPYSVNHAQLHTDTSVLPRTRGARASWNHLTPAGRRDAAGVIVTYDISRLMRLERQVRDRRFLVTLGGAHLVDPNTVIDEMTYEHPLYTPESVAAQAQLPQLASDVLAFAGAYHGWGFHEDGAASGLRAAERIGGSWDRPRTTTEPDRAEAYA